MKILDGVAAGEHTERNLILDLALALAEDRRRDISRKTKNGLEAARKRGTTGGRPSVVTDDRRRTILARRAEGESIRQIAAGIGISTAVVHRVLHQADEHSTGSEAEAASALSGQRQATLPASTEPETVPADTISTAPTEEGARAIGTRERIDPDSVHMERNPHTGAIRVLGTARSGEPVLVGLLERQGRQWHAYGPQHTRIVGHWRTRNEALLRLVEGHAG